MKEKPIHKRTLTRCKRDFVRTACGRAPKRESFFRFNTSSLHKDTMTLLKASVHADISPSFWYLVSTLCALSKWWSA